MKNVSKFFYAFVILFATVLYSCDKEIETSPLTIDKTKTATIKGIVYAELDKTHFGLETAPAGSKVIITMPYSELGLSNTGSLNDTVLLDADGSFTYTVPADANGVNVTAKVIDFVYNQKQEFNDQYPTKSTLYAAVSTGFSVKANDFSLKEIKMETTSVLGQIYNWYTVEGIFYADYDKSVAGDEKLPAGTSIIINSAGWSKTITLAADGKYSVLVPGGTAISATYNFTIQGKLSDATPVTYRYKGTVSVGQFAADDKIKNLYLSDGVTE